jgi:hypothetical protein
MTHVTEFIAANPKAYKAASAVFKRIEANDFAETLASAGIVGHDIKVFATIYVAEQTGVNPHPSQRGGSLVFKKDSAEYNRAKYLADVAMGVREVRAARTAKASNARVSSEAKAAAKALIKLCGSVAAAKAALAAV